MTTINNPTKTTTEDTGPLYTRSEAAEVGAQRLTFRWWLPSQTQTVTLGGIRYRVTAFYRARLGSWYMHIRTQAGVDILLGRRVSPGWSVNLGHHPDNEPDGILVVSEFEPYRKDSLGNNLTITFYPTNRLKPTPPDAFSAVSVDLD
jgi:hypothetical protein